MVGRSFEHALLAEIVGVDDDGLGFAIAQVRRAGLVEAAPGAVSRFVHDSVREALLEGVDPANLRVLHQRVAEVLDVSGADPYLLARHYAAGEVEPSAARLIEVSHAAAEQALAAFDNEAVLRFFDAAQGAARRTGRELPPALLIDVAEAELRLGSDEESIAHLDAALPQTSDPLARARILGRIAWAEQARSDEAAAWDALERAFAELDERLPVESPATVATTGVRWLESRLRRSGAPNRRRGARPDRSALRPALPECAARAGPREAAPAPREHADGPDLGAASRCRSHAGSHGSALRNGRHHDGATRSGANQLRRARRMAAEARHPPTVAYCDQLSALGHCFAGEFDPALEYLRSLLFEQSHWLELNEVCINAFNAYLIEALRGRPREAWSMLERAISRVARHGRAHSGFGVIAGPARATWAMLHRQEDERAFRQALRVPFELDEPPSAVTRVATWGPQARYFLERSNLAPNSRRWWRRIARRESIRDAPTP